MGIYIKGITVEMFRNAPLEAIEELMAEGQIIDVPEPHGRLVDMDKALEVIALEYGYDGIEDDMKYKVPTIIESEVEE